MTNLNIDIDDDFVNPDIEGQGGGDKSSAGQWFGPRHSRQVQSNQFGLPPKWPTTPKAMSNPKSVVTKKGRSNAYVPPPHQVSTRATSYSGNKAGSYGSNRKHPAVNVTELSENSSAAWFEDPRGGTLLDPNDVAVLEDPSSQYSVDGTSEQGHRDRYATAGARAT